MLRNKTKKYKDTGLRVVRLEDQILFVEDEDSESKDFIGRLALKLFHFAIKISDQQMVERHLYGVYSDGYRVRLLPLGFEMA